MGFDSNRGMVVITRVGGEELVEPKFENKRSEEALENIQVEAHCYII